MNTVKVAIVGAGNISNTRHIPGLRHVKSADIVGVLSNKAERAENTARKHNIDNFAVINDKLKDGGLGKLDWFAGIDAVVIGAPPTQHYALVKLALTHDKHVLIEKPMMMDQHECDELIELAKKKNKIFYVMHNFQYAHKMIKLNEIIESKRYGEICNITETQFTNHDRRLPEWYNDLPMGLFYDEAAHFMYLLENHAGKLKINNSYAVYDKDKKANTPNTLTVSATAGNVPVTMLLNFKSAVCEWHYIVSFEKRILIYDFFKDILIDLPSDNEHRAADILKNSLSFSWQYWTQFIGNGFRMLRRDLLYGHDIVLGKFISAVETGGVDDKLVAESGRTNVNSINEIIDKANKR
jgi:predicted dehydrogenase